MFNKVILLIITSHCKYLPIILPLNVKFIRTMSKKRNSTVETISVERKEILDMCYKRLRELIPECSNEVTLIKCIEILEKRERIPAEVEDEKHSFMAIASTLKRLSEMK